MKVVVSLVILTCTRLGGPHAQAKTEQEDCAGMIRKHKEKASAVMVQDKSYRGIDATR